MTKRQFVAPELGRSIEVRPPPPAGAGPAAGTRRGRIGGSAMGDGAHQGLRPETAMKRAFGAAVGDGPGMDVLAFREWIEAAPFWPESYDDAARLAAKLVLHHLMRHPEDGDAPAESVYDLIREKSPATFIAIEAVDLTRFQWGWAVNAARRCLEMPPIANRAIVEF